MSNFYIGYLPKAPDELARFIRKIVVGLGLLAVGLCCVVVRGQRPFLVSTFEFGTTRDFTGVIVARPYPTLLVSRPGQTGAREGASQYLLVAPGKHGADSLVAGWVGKAVGLKGQLIYRDGQTMVEVEPGSITERGAAAVPAGEMLTLGEVTLDGEIVDSKCYLGVMNPGNGKVHRDCAARCLSGGIPPLFVTTDGRRQFLLVGADGHALAQDALREFVAEPIRIHGELLQAGDQQRLRIDPRSLQHPPDGLSARARVPWATRKRANRVRNFSM